MSERIEAQAPLDEGLPTDGNPAAGSKEKKTLDPGAKRNILIIASAVGAAVLLMIVMFVSFSSGPKVAERGLPTSVIPNTPAATRSAGALTPEEIARLERVQGREAAAAAAQGRTFVPSDIPIEVERPTPTPAPPAPPPPMVNYNIQTGASTQAASQAETERMQRIMQGFQAQMARIADANMVPTTSSAPRYNAQSPQQGAQAGASQGVGTQAAQPAADPASAQAATLVAALSISAAETTTTINTERTSFVSARIVAGPAAGATLYGTSEMVSDQGVRITFSRMLFDGQSYNINAIALDPADSHDLINANVDRKLFERYVLPIFGSMGSAYFNARARQAQRVIVGSGGDVVAVDQDEPTAKQSVAEALASGMATAVERLSNQPTQPSATLPAGASLGILFLDPVLASGASQTGRWQSASGR